MPGGHFKPSTLARIRKNNFNQFTHQVDACLIFNCFPYFELSPRESEI